MTVRKARADGMRGPSKLRVLVQVAQGNPFVGLLIDAMPEDIVFEPFSWVRSLRGDYDVLHLHWPESLVRHPLAGGRLAKRFLFILLIILNYFRGKAHISTIHNVSPHEKGEPAEQRVVRRWIKSCNQLVYLSQAGRDRSLLGDGTVIPHGDYSKLVSEYASAIARPTPGRMILFGYLRRYKGIEALLDAFGQLPDDEFSLAIVGQPLPSAYVGELTAYAGRFKNVELTPSRATDAELLHSIYKSEMVVLPYRSMYNSGAVLLALSAGRPVIVTASETMQELSREVGPEWLHCLDQPLDGDNLIEAIRYVRRAPRGERPQMIGRDWPSIASAYRDAYLALSTKR